MATCTPMQAGWARPSTVCPSSFASRFPPAGLIANPGCYTSASILALAPLIAEDRIERTGIIIDAKSGVSGAGRSPKLTTHFPECNESLSAYSVGRHRHTPEIDQVLTEVTRGRGEKVEVIFTPHLVPMDRGIFATIYAHPKGPPPSSTTCSTFIGGIMLAARSSGVVEHLPATKDSAFTNYCDITVRVVRGRIVVLVLSRQSGQRRGGVAVQNLNLMLGCRRGDGASLTRVSMLDTPVGSSRGWPLDSGSRSRRISSRSGGSNPSRVSSSLCADLRSPR